MTSTRRPPTSSQTVATRDASTPSPSKKKDRESSDTLRQSLTSRVDRQREILYWMEQLLEPSVDADAFKRALYYLPASTHPQILHERHLSSLCSYPLCANPPSKPFESYPTPRSKIFRSSEGGKRIVQIWGNEHEGFCRKRESAEGKVVGGGCARKWEWVARRVEGLRRESGDGGNREEEVEEGKGWGDWELLEEVEERLEIGEGEHPAVVGALADEIADTSGATTTDGEAKPPSPSKQLPRSSPSSLPTAPIPAAPIAPPNPPLPAKNSTAAIQSLLSSLEIYERPTSSEPLIAPSLSHPSQSGPLPSSPSRSLNSPSSTPSKTGSLIPSSLASAREKERKRRLNAAGGGGLVPGGLGLGTVGGMLIGAQKRAASSSQRLPDEDGEEEAVAGEGEVAQEEEEEEEEGKEDWDLMALAREEMLRSSGGS